MNDFIRMMILPLILFSCSPQEKGQNLTGRREHTRDENVVVTTTAKKGSFYKEFENNGKLEASQKAVLRFEESGNILSVNVKNGQWVQKGTVLAKVENSQQLFNYEKACRNLEKCRLNLEEGLINQGYTLADSAKVPANSMKIAMIRSGYRDAVNDKKLAARKLKQTEVIAPFNGIVADLKAKPYNETANYKEFCTLIDNHDFEVSFPVLEAEMAQMEPGMEVEIIPFAFEKDTFIGSLSEINPRVAENGMVEVKALVKNKMEKLAEGMNVKVLVKKELGNKIYIPKEAVTLRQERNVVFIHRNDTAIWSYVGVGPTNSRFTTINWGVEEGDEVIIEGHFNIAHQAIVKVIKKL